MSAHRRHGPGSIRCEPTGCCRWVGSGSARAARVRIYESSRGPLPRAVELETSCGDRRCVNVDHLRLARRVRVAGDLACRRGHEVSAANVVRHSDGRIAYCRLCRNERRRERYRSDAGYARRERERQRRIRRSQR